MERAFLDLLNSDWHDWRGSGESEDRLDRGGWIEEFLSAWGWRIPSDQYAQLPSALKKLRSLMKTVFLKVANGDRLSSFDVRQLNDVLAKAAYRKKVLTITKAEREMKNGAETGATNPPASGRLKIGLEPACRDLDWVLAKVIESFVEALADNDPGRFKICANPDCRWFFLDESRGMTRSWCESKTCGNLMKVRRFRERHRRNQPS